MARRPRQTPPAKFHTRLVLNHWVWGLFGFDTTDGYVEFEGRKRPVLEVFREKFQVNAHSAEGLDPSDNTHHFLHAMLNRPEPVPGLTEDELRQYDQNIVRHTLKLNETRRTRGQDEIRWKYFQYLTLLFTEIFLDRFFRDPAGLRAEINAHIDAFNDSRPEQDHIERFDDAGDAAIQLNKLAFWSATGSGKTLLMHVNILQYQHYVDLHGRRRDLNRIILLTPNEGLSRQHLEEFRAAGLQAELFDKDGKGLFAGRSVEILDIHKLAEEGKQKTISVEAFESSNLVLIDEGHRGVSSGEEGEWMRFRNALCERGFSFEYSATFGQAVKGNGPLQNLYAKAVLFDYSYRFFYADGYGKDYHILNLDDETEQNKLEPYLTACLLAFFEQQCLYDEAGERLKLFGIAKPLLVFVGGTVTKTLSSREASDIVEMVRFLAHVLGTPKEIARRIDALLNDGLVAADGRNIFSGLFRHLRRTGKNGASLYREMLASLFNAEAGGALHLDILKGQDGEIALRIGDNEPFGVINVGDPRKLADLCEKYPELHVHEKDFGDSLFDGLKAPNSTVHVLIGSKKFTEGWNSLRVSTMGLMNIGSTEGSQIIQLFGRGVRLRGYQGCLRRSSHADLPSGLERPLDLGLLETLNVFGVRANYMAEFRKYLEEEGLPPNEEPHEVLLPVIRSRWSSPLKTLRLKPAINGVSTRFGDPFKRFGPKPTLRLPDTDHSSRERYLFDHRVTLNWYPKVKAVRAEDIATVDDEASLHTAVLTSEHVALLDLDAVYFELLRYKAERAWHNLNITRDAVSGLLEDTTWYQLQIPQSEMAFDSYEKVQLWQEIATALVKKYCDRFYSFKKREWELPHLEYQILTPDDPNFAGYSEDDEDHFYRVLVDKSRTDILADINRLKTAIENHDLDRAQFGGVTALWFDRHLYEPLLHFAGGGELSIRPVVLNSGERRFVEDIRAYCTAQPPDLHEVEVYLLRNRSRGGGVGFFEAGNFHPDFMLWMVQGERQSIAFVDPKGLLSVGPEDPKVRFHATVKEIESRLADTTVRLESFIVATTPLALVRNRWAKTADWLRAHHILFPQDDPGYVGSLFATLLTPPSASASLTSPVPATAASWTAFTAGTYPETPKDQGVIFAALSAIEQSGGMSSIDLLDVLLLSTHSEWCKPLLSVPDQDRLDKALAKAGVAGVLKFGSADSIRWKAACNFLEAQAALAVDRSKPNQIVSAGPSLNAAKTKAVLPVGVGPQIQTVVVCALKAVGHLRKHRGQANAAPQRVRSVHKAVEQQRDLQLQAV
jgi:hypothetical protein